MQQLTIFLVFPY